MILDTSVECLFIVPLHSWPNRLKIVGCSGARNLTMKYYVLFVLLRHMFRTTQGSLQIPNYRTGRMSLDRCRRMYTS